MKTSGDSIYFPHLDGLRFVLALVVFSSHSMLGSALTEIIPFDFGDRLAHVLTAGSLGVSFFFVLSGFLITYLMIEEKEATGHFSVRNFYVRRILRIWPLYYVLLTFTYFVYPWLKSFWGYPDLNPYSFLHQALFLANFDSIDVHRAGLVDVAPMMVGINWSIAIEEQFYLVWPLIFFFVRTSRFLIVIVLLITASCLGQAFLLQDIALYYHTLSVTTDLAVGALFAYLAFYSHEFRAAIGKMHRVWIAIIYVAGFLFVMYEDLVPSQLYPISHLIRVTFFAFIVFEQSFASASFYKFGHSRWMSSMGKYTYSIYLLHPLGVQFSIVAFRFLGLDRGSSFALSMLYVVVAAVPTFLLSLASYHLLEKYFLGLRKHFYAPRPPAVLPDQARAR